MADATQTSRYQGKPLLRLLECYVLWAINELPADMETSLVLMAPKLGAVYNVKGDWQEVVESAMKFPPDLPSQIKHLWTKNTQIANAHGANLTPQKFAELFVDDNFDHHTNVHDKNSASVSPPGQPNKGSGERNT